MLAIDIIECPQKVLRKSFHDKKIDGFKRALSLGADVNKREIDASRTPPRDYSVFEMACRDAGCGVFIKECLKNGAIVTRIHPTEKSFPIHLVALSSSAENMRALLTSKDVVVDQKYKDRTALYILFENIDQESHREGFECITLLLDAGANINAVQEDNVSPVQLLLEKVANGVVPSGDNEWPKDVLEHCLSKSKSPVNLSLNDGKAQTLISQHFSSLDIPERHGMSTVTVEQLKNKLFVGRYTSEDFIEIYEQYRERLSNEELKDMIVIAVCSDKLKAAQHLIDPRLDGTNGTIRENLLETLLPGLLEKCCNRGIYSALEWLLQIIPKTARAFINKEPLLCILIKRMNAEVNLMKRSFSKCFYLLLHDPRIELDMPDSSSDRTALHYAVMYKMQPVQLALLGKGAQLGSMDILGNICEIDPTLREKHLDTRLSKAIVDDARFDVIIDLSDFIKSTSPTKETKCESEIYPILQLAQHPANKRLLLHPVISTIVQLKLNYLCRASLVYVMYHFIHWIGLTCLMVYCGDIYLGQSNGTLYYYFTVPAVVYIIARLLITYAIDRENFRQRSENWLQIVLTIEIIFAIVVNIFFTVHEEMYRMCCATAVMLLSVEFTAVLAKVSSFSISTNLILLKAILINFCKSLIPFSSILIAWALTLHILFKERHHMDSAALGETGTQKNNTVEQVTGNNEFNKFQTVWLAGIKTIVMMTGELDATNIPFEDCVFKSVILLMSIFFVALVFNNFINGLAVDDTMTMRAESEYISLKQKIFLIHRLETILNLLWTSSNAFNWSWLSQETTTIKLPQYIKIQQKPLSEHASKIQWHNLKRMFKGLKDEEKKETIVVNEENCHILNRALEILNSCAEAHYVNTETTKNLNDSASDDRLKLILGGGQTKRRHSI